MPRPIDVRRVCSTVFGKSVRLMLPCDLSLFICLSCHIPLMYKGCALRLGAIQRSWKIRRKLRGFMALHMSGCALDLRMRSAYAQFKCLHLKVDSFSSRRLLTCCHKNDYSPRNEFSIDPGGSRVFIYRQRHCPVFYTSPLQGLLMLDTALETGLFPQKE